MSKKIFLYGLAFGSACGALNYIYYASSVYKGSSSIHILFLLLENLILPALAIFLFLKMFKRDSPNEFTFGKAVFYGFFVSIFIGGTISLIYSYIYQFHGFYINQLIDYKINQTTANLSKQKEIADTTTYITESYKPGFFFKNQMMLATSRGLFLSAIFAYFLKAKTANENSNTPQK